MRRVDLNEKLAQFDGFFSPKIVASFNDNDIQLVKVKGDFRVALT